MAHVEENNFIRVPNMIRALLHMPSVQKLQNQAQCSWIKRHSTQNLYCPGFLPAVFLILADHVLS